MHNLQSFWTVTKFTMRDMVGRKSFRISTIVILLLIIVGFNIPNLLQDLNGGDFTSTIFVSDPNNLFEGNIPAFNNPELGFKFENTDLSLEDLKSKIDSSSSSSAIIIENDDNTPKITYLTDNASMMNGFPAELANILQMIYLNQQIAKLNLSESELASLNINFEFELKQANDQEIVGNIGVAMILSVILFFAIYFCAYQVSSSITTEKTSRIMETLVTSTSPRAIILGKTVGVGIVGLLQTSLFVATAILAATTCLSPELLSQVLDLSNFTPLLWVVTIIYFVLGYFAYALLYALTGSTVSKPEDVQIANTPVVILTMIGFYLAYFTLTDPTGELNLFASILPISSPFCMPLRVMMGLATLWEVVISIAVLIIFCIIVTKIAIKIYSSAIFNYGTRMTLKDIVKTYRDKK